MIADSSANNVGDSTSSGGSAPGMEGQAPQTSAQNAACSVEVSPAGGGHDRAIPNHDPTTVGGGALCAAAFTFGGALIICDTKAIAIAVEMVSRDFLKVVMTHSWIFLEGL